MSCYIIDTRNILVEDRAVPEGQGRSQHMRICRDRPFNVILNFEVCPPDALFVEYSLILRRARRRSLFIIVPDWPISEGEFPVAARSRQEVSNDFTIMVQFPSMQTGAYKLLNILVGCHKLHDMKPILEEGEVDLRGPYQSGAILCAALARGPMATRLVLDYGASRFLGEGDNHKLGLQALIHHACLGDPSTNRTARLLWEEGVLLSEDVEELHGTYNHYKLMDPKMHKCDLEVLRRVRDMVDVMKTPLSLAQLSKRSLCRSLGPLPQRREKLAGLEIGEDIRRLVLPSDFMDVSLEHFSIVHDCALREEKEKSNPGLL